VVLGVDVSYRCGYDADRAGSGSTGCDHVVADHVPSRVKVGLVAFADDPVVVTSSMTDRSLSRRASHLVPGTDGNR
jgi:hypothetical protein